MSTWTSTLQAEWGNFYPTAPAFIVQTPGRVNLIGEHVDHQGYAVCPCAIEQSMAIMFSLEPKTENNTLLEIANLKKDEYPHTVFTSIKDIKVSDKKVWGNYVAASYLGMCEFYLQNRNAENVGKTINPKHGLTEEQIKLSLALSDSLLKYSVKMLVTGNVPIAAGLSSSGALVVAVTYALAHLSPSPASNTVLADITARSERYNGVASGGMDQAAILLSKKGSATLIRFNPVRTWEVNLPSGGALIIVNTCREAPKAKMAAKMYNKRVFELKVGCLALLPRHEADKITADELLDLQLMDVVRQRLATSEESLLARLPSVMNSRVWNKHDVMSLVGKERIDVLLAKRCGEDVWHQNDDFHVFQRIKHVLAEACRVEDFARICDSKRLSDQDKLYQLGDLMNSSGTSMRDDFDATCAEVDEVVALLRSKGALGARVTGAGWGGCVVAIASEHRVPELIKAVKEKYFIPIFDGRRTMSPPLECLPNREHLDRVVFATSPSQGAFISRL